MEHLEKSDQRIVEGCIAGNPKYQKMLYEKFAKELYFTCKRYSNSDTDAEDLLQNVFIKVFLSLKNFRFESSLRTWLYRITTNEVISNFRKKKNQGTQIDYEECEQAVLPVIEIIDADIPLDVLMEMVQSLPAGYRTVFNLREIEGLEYDEIASQLEMNPQTVRSQLFKAKRSLKKQIENWLKSENR